MKEIIQMTVRLLTRALDSSVAIFGFIILIIFILSIF